MENPLGSRRKAPHVLNLCYSLMVIVNLKHLFEKLFLKLVQGPGPGSKLKCEAWDLLKFECRKVSQLVTCDTVYIKF